MTRTSQTVYIRFVSYWTCILSMIASGTAGLVGLPQITLHKEGVSATPLWSEQSWQAWALVCAGALLAASLPIRQSVGGGIGNYLRTITLSVALLTSSSVGILFMMNGRARVPILIVVAAISCSAAIYVDALKVTYTSRVSMGRRESLMAAVLVIIVFLIALAQLRANKRLQEALAPAIADHDLAGVTKQDVVRIDMMRYGSPQATRAIIAFVNLDEYATRRTLPYAKYLVEHNPEFELYLVEERSGKEFDRFPSVELNAVADFWLRFQRHSITVEDVGNEEIRRAARTFRGEYCRKTDSGDVRERRKRDAALFESLSVRFTPAFLIEGSDGALSCARISAVIDILRKTTTVFESDGLVEEHP